MWSNTIHYDLRLSLCNYFPFAWVTGKVMLQFSVKWNMRWACVSGS